MMAQISIRLMYLNCRGDKDAQTRFEIFMGKTTGNNTEKNDNDNEGLMKDNEDHDTHKKKKKKKKHKYKEQLAK